MNVKHNNKDYIIGSAQIGQDYGIAGSNHLNSKKNAIKFIQRAIKNNFLSFDTASSYGYSEEYIGHATENIDEEIKIYTKIPKLKEDSILIAEEHFNESLKKLKKRLIEGLFLHNPLDWEINGMKNFLIQLKKKNQIKKLGLSIYDEKDIPLDKNLDLIQIPGNIFNQRLLRSPKLLNFNKNGGTVIIRSIFIQGLIFLDNNSFPKNLITLQKPILELRELVLDNNITIEALAIKTIEKLCPYGKLVIGCNDIMQLEILLKATNTNINNNILEEAINIGRKYDSILWDPRNWN